MNRPLTPSDCDLRDFPRMMLDIARLRGSAFDAALDDAAWRAGINLWMTAWHQVPAASLENDDAALTKAAGLGRDLKTWRKVKSVALRGWVLAEDGLLYHETLAEFALEAWLDKLGSRLSSGAGNAKRYGHEFDPATLYLEIREAAGMLSALNDKSRSLSKQHVLKAIKGTPFAPAEPQPAVPVDLPVGDPVGSQGNGKERNGVDVEDVDRARESDADPATVWSNRVLEAHAAGDGWLDLTVPAMHTALTLRSYCEPSSGEPCTWAEVLEAIRLCAIRAKARNEPIRSWSWIKREVLALRDQRLNAHLPSPEARREHQPSHHTDKFDRKQANLARAVAGFDRVAGSRERP